MDVVGPVTMVTDKGTHVSRLAVMDGEWLSWHWVDICPLNLQANAVVG